MGRGYDDSLHWPEEAGSVEVIRGLALGYGLAWSNSVDKEDAALLARIGQEMKELGRARESAEE